MTAGRIEMGMYGNLGKPFTWSYFDILLYYIDMKTAMCFPFASFSVCDQVLAF